MSNTYTNPLANKAVALIGRFESFNTLYAWRVLEQMGAVAERGVTNSTEIVVVGAKPGKKLDKVIKLGIEQWDEAQLIQALADYNSHLHDQPNASSFDPLVPAFQYDNERSFYPERLYGLPSAHQVHEQFIGDQYAYIIDLRDAAGMWDTPGVDTLQALVIEHITDDTWAAFAQHLDRLPNLKALVINQVRNTQQPIDAAQLLAMLPQLESLFFTSDSFNENSGIALDVARHSNLQQLYINGTVVGGLSLVSLPKLRLLHIEKHTLNDTVDGLNSGAYPRLNVIQVFDQENCITLLKHIPALPQIQRLKLVSGAWRDSQSIEEQDQQLRQLATWEGTQQLSHLDLTHISPPQLAALKRKDFPKLSHLQLRAFFQQNNANNIPQLDLWQGLHVTISKVWLNDDILVESLIALLQAQTPLASLSFNQQNHSFTPEQEALFADLPYPVYFG